METTIKKKGRAKRKPPEPGDTIIKNDTIFVVSALAKANFSGDAYYDFYAACLKDGDIYGFSKDKVEPYGDWEYCDVKIEVTY